MVAGTPLYQDLAYVFVAAVLGGFVARWLRQPLILGYVLGGILIGPFTPGPRLADIHELELFAEIGVILLMYSIGIEFSIRDLMRVKWVALLGAPLGILLSIALGIAVGHTLGWSTAQSITMGAVISVASTMVLSRVLIDRGDLRSAHGQVMISITLVEDLAVVIMTVLVPTLGASRREITPIYMAVGKALLLLIPIGIAATTLIPPLMARVARVRSRELYLLVALGLGFAVAACTQAIGLSLALGAFLAGMAISGSEYEHETLAHLLPLRDAFVALFFVTVGALIDPRALISNPQMLLVLLGLIVVGKLAIWSLVIKLFRYPLWTAVLAAAGLTQIGEFSYVLVQAARRADVVSADFYNATLAASLVSILLNPAVIRGTHYLAAKRQLARAVDDLARSPENFRAQANDVLLCGFGRVGSAIGIALDTFGTRYVVIENDPEVVKDLRNRGIPAVFGDSSHATVLEQAGIGHSKLVVLTFPDSHSAERTVRSIRRLAAKVPVLARAHGIAEREQLLAAGASAVVQPELEASAALVRQALSFLQLPEQKTAAYLDTFKQAMQSAIGQQAATSQAEFPQVREVIVGAGVSGVSLRQGRFRERFGITVVGIERKEGERMINPPAEARLFAGDVVRVFGRIEQIQRFSSFIAPEEPETLRRVGT